MKDTVRKGNITELRVQTKLLELNYDVFSPVGDGSRCDLIIIINNEMSRVQVKTSRVSRDSEVFNAYSCGCTRSKTAKSTRIRYTKNDIDYFATIGSRDRMYLIPVEDVSTQEPKLRRFERFIV